MSFGTSLGNREWTNVNIKFVMILRRKSLIQFRYFTLKRTCDTVVTGIKIREVGGLGRHWPSNVHLLTRYWL
jgi:hypothetical protein